MKTMKITTKWIMALAFVTCFASTENHFTAFDSAFSAVPHITCYSVKANSNLSLIKLFSDLGGGLDVVSGGEIFRALRAGVSPAKIVYSGVGKTRAEIEYALDP